MTLGKDGGANDRQDFLSASIPGTREREGGAVRILDGSNAFTKEIKCSADDIPMLIHNMANQFAMSYGFQLKAFLIGPYEYGALIEVIRKSVFHGGQDVMLGKPETFLGMEIRLKGTRGIEPEYPKEMWHRIAMGTIR